MRTNESGLFPALEAVLKASTEPFTCQELYDLPEIQKHAASVNRVSDYLGGLWRKGLVVRLAAPKSDNSRARRMYQWKGSRGPSCAVVRPPCPKASSTRHVFWQIAPRS